MSDKNNIKILIAFIYFTVALNGYASQDAKYIAHRGASYIAPENTLSSVLLAWDLGADCVEVDVRMTHDNHIVVIHDGDTKRIAGVDLKVKEASLKELQELDVGKWKNKKYAGEKIPLLKEIIETIPVGKQLFVEIKCHETILPHLKLVIGNSDKQKQITIICFNLDVLKKAKQLMPEIPAYWLVGTKKDKSTNLYIPHDPKLIKISKQNNIDGLNVHYAGIDHTFINAIKNSGQDLYAYTINDPDIASHLMEIGIKGITTDRPHWLMLQMESDLEKKKGTRGQNERQR